MIPLKRTNKRATFYSQFDQKKLINNNEILMLLRLFSLGEVKHQRDDNLTSSRVPLNISTQIKKFMHFLSITSKERKVHNETLRFSTETNIQKKKNRARKSHKQQGEKNREKNDLLPIVHGIDCKFSLHNTAKNAGREDASSCKRRVRVLYSTKRIASESLEQKRRRITGQEHKRNKKKKSGSLC